MHGATSRRRATIRKERKRVREREREREREKRRKRLLDGQSMSPAGEVIGKL